VGYVDTIYWCGL